MSSAAPVVKGTAEARAPKRARGHARVSAILDAGAAVLVEKGYDGATMTEIAARSSTAIGSLYRFFPTKAALADALLARYAQDVGGNLAAIEAHAASLPLAALADALVDFMLERRTDRAAALALVDVAPDGAHRRAEIRAAMRRGLAAILRRAAPHLDDAEAADAAAVLLQMLKGARVLADEAGPGSLTGLRTAIRLYLAHCLSADGPEASR